MIKFSQLPEYEKELKKLSKKYPSLESDIEDLKLVLAESSTGIGKNFTIISSTENIKIVKVKVHCESLRSRSIRLIYAYHKDKIEFMYLEIYAKGEKVSEDRARVVGYLNHNKLI